MVAWPRRSFTGPRASSRAAAPRRRSSAWFLAAGKQLAPAAALGERRGGAPRQREQQRTKTEDPTQRERERERES
uniref:Uncharacterized protein n=1 Tax=Arundo donax TaxID=35708 RepID=A0A0A9EQG6_ARUDO